MDTELLAFMLTDYATRYRAKLSQIAALESTLRQRDDRIAELESQVGAGQVDDATDGLEVPDGAADRG